MFSNRIAELRKRHGRKGVTPAHLARKIGVSRSYISKLERHLVTPSAKVMFKIADYLECRVEDVFQYESDRDRREK